MLTRVAVTRPRSSWKRFSPAIEQTDPLNHNWVHEAIAAPDFKDLYGRIRRQTVLTQTIVQARYETLVEILTDKFIN